jgi:hypothetical protein
MLDIEMLKKIKVPRTWYTVNAQFRKAEKMRDKRKE